MKTRFVTFSLLIAAAFAVAAAQPGSSSQQKIRFSGTLIDASGKPVVGATVELFRYERGFSSEGDEIKPDQTVTSGNAGTFEFQAPASPMVAFARKEGLAPSWCTSWNPTGDVEEQLVLGHAASISGIVVDDADKPVPDAKVWLTTAYLERPSEGGGTWHYLPMMPHRDSYSTRTGPDGRFRIKGCPTNAAFDLALSKPGKVLREAQRQHVSNDTMRWSPGQKEVRLVVDAAGTVEGKVRSRQTGEPIARASIHLIPQRPGGGMVPQTEPGVSAPDGTFKLTEVAPGSYRVQTSISTNALPALVAEILTINVEAGRITRYIEIEAVKPGLLEVSVVGKEDQKRLPQVFVNAGNQNYNAGSTSDTNGIACLSLAPGTYHVSAYLGNSRSEQDSVSVEAGSTNRIQIEVQPPRQVKGIVLDPSGKPAPDLQVRVVPEWRVNLGTLKTDAEGRFAFPWNPSASGAPNETCSIVVRDVQRNLAVAVDLEEQASAFELRLQPGLSIAGRVEDLKGEALSNATVQVYFWAGNSGFSFDNKPIRTDGEGHFEIRALPPGRRYSANATAKAYGSQSQAISSEEGETNRIELAPFVLNVADRKLAGQVVDAEDKPVINAWVHMYGQGQPNASKRTDQQGYFRFEEVCEGSVQLSASTQGSYASARAEAGDTNVVLKLGVNSYALQEAPRRPSLKGKPLPDLAETDLAKDCAPAGKIVLLCLVDIEQRPCRRFVRLLSEQHAALREQGLTALALQAAPATAEALKEWKDANPMPFQIGQLTEKSDKTKWASSVESFPWLILADKDHNVSAEGFALEELEAKLKELTQAK